MRTFGRVLASLGVGLAVIGGVGALAMMPRPVLDDAVNYVEEHRQALRSHLPEIPPMQDLIVGTSQSDCAQAGTDLSQDPAAADSEGCAAPDETAAAAEGGLLTRSRGASSRFRAPASTKAADGASGMGSAPAN